MNSSDEHPPPILSLVRQDSRSENEKAAARLRLSLAMYEDGLELKTMQLRREYPELSESEIAKKLSDWLANRSGPTVGVAREDLPWGTSQE